MLYAWMLGLRRMATSTRRGNEVPKAHPSDPTKGMWCKLLMEKPARQNFPPLWHLKQFVFASIPPIVAYFWLKSVEKDMNELTKQKQDWLDAETNRLRAKHLEQANTERARIERLEARIAQLEQATTTDPHASPLPPPPPPPSSSQQASQASTPPTCSSSSQ